MAARHPRRRAAVLAPMLVLTLALASAAPALATEPEEQLANPAQEARARAIGRELRCVVCQGQTIDDSQAPVASALRRLVRDRIQAGDDDDQVMDQVTRRYGDSVRLQPRLNLRTALLWFGPLAALALGAAGAIAFVRRGGGEIPAAAPLDEAERAELDRALEG